MSTRSLVDAVSAIDHSFSHFGRPHTERQSGTRHRARPHTETDPERERDHTQCRPHTERQSVTSSFRSISQMAEMPKS